MIKIKHIVLLFIGLIIITGSGIYCSNNKFNTSNTLLNLTGKAVSSSQINLNWISGSNSKINFKIERKTDPISAYNKIATVASNINSYSDIGLKEDTVYYYRILAYDSNLPDLATGQAGNYSRYSNEVSVSTAISWILATSKDTNPSARYGHAMAYDSARNRIVLFGGSDWTDETWEREGTEWILKSPVHKPLPRYGHAMAYDSARGKVVLFGGMMATLSDTYEDIRSDETWEWDGTDWTLKTPVHKPSGRRVSAMAYDSKRAKTILSGGETDIDYSDETWEWDGTDWTLRTPVHKPLGQWGTAMAYDSNRHKIFFFRGFGWMTEMCEWDGANWVITTPANNSAKCSHAMAYDPIRDRMVLIGQDETWEYDDTNWSLKSPEDKPMPIWGHALVYDDARHKVVLFGGFVGCYPINDTWEWGY
ncbi:MAG: fibronectin type III domain-containing protein [Planctomycetota bacterium]